jgi:hypothetical protein
LHDSLLHIGVPIGSGSISYLKSYGCFTVNSVSLNKHLTLK